MREITKQQAIRSLVNGYQIYDKRFKEWPDDWNILCAALDTLGDACFGLVEFEENGFGSELGAKYLRLYGAMQAIVLQAGLHPAAPPSDVGLQSLNTQGLGVAPTS